MKWEEPFDSTLYCVQSDGHYAVITGTARHGMVRLWDKRHSRPIQVGNQHTYHNNGLMFFVTDL